VDRRRFADDVAKQPVAVYPVVSKTEQRTVGNAALIVTHRLLAWLAACLSLWVFVPPIPVLSLFFLSCLGEFVVFAVLFR